MKKSKVIIQRFSDNGNSTIGMMFIDGKFFCYVLEDEFREVKKMGETRIPAGIYELGIKDVLTGLTKKHRSSYGSWFEYHIEILNIPNFKTVYLHVGNKETHTDGCPLLGESANNNQVAKGFISSSMAACKRFYEVIYPLLKGGEKVFIEVRDEGQLGL